MYKQIAANVRASWILVILTCLLLALVGFAIGTAVVAHFGMPFPGTTSWRGPAVRIGGTIGMAVAGGVAVVMSLVSYFAGDRCVLAASQAKKIQKRDHPRLFNVVEEMAIAAGISMPEVYVINDSAPNAFATGRKPETAKVAITTGLLTKLNRDELQGVMAHEVSHIRNHDILFATMLGVLVGTIVLLCDMFWRSMWYGGRGRSRRRGQGAGGGVLMLVALLLALVAPLLAKLIQLAVSRQREYLADASAALLTRYPLGLASALRKISADPEVLEVANRATQHLYIVNPIKSFEKRAQSLFSTHPDTEDRIRRLEEMGHGPAARPFHGPAKRLSRAAGEAARPLGVDGLDRIFGRVEGGTVPVPAPAPAASQTGEAASLVGALETAAAAAIAPLVGQGTCPRCRDRLRKVVVGGRTLKGCNSCGGIWVGGGHLSELLDTFPQKLKSVDRKFLNFVGHGWDRVSRRTCPDCPGAPPLTEERLAKAGGVPVDICYRCNGVWFDDGELSMVVARLSQGRKAGV